jgi:hypothetical protein
MSREFNGEPSNQDLGHPVPAPPNQGITNSSQGLGQRRSTQSLSRHFSIPGGLDSSEINRNFWETFIATTRRRYESAPDLRTVTNLAHPMHPNIDIPAQGDDLDDHAGRGPRFNACVNWPMQGPTANRLGPNPGQNPSETSLSDERESFKFAESRKSRWE